MQLSTVVRRLFPRLLTTSVVLSVLACTGPAAPDSFARGAGTTSVGSADTLTAVLELTNAERLRAGIPALRQSRQLASAAQLQSEQMGSMGQMDHVIPGAPYPTPKDRLAAVNYAWEAYGENVAMGQRSGVEVVTAWMHSSGHRANILNPRYTELGVGVALDAGGRAYYAEVFGRPVE